MRRGRIGPCNHRRCVPFGACSRCGTTWNHVEHRIVDLPWDGTWPMRGYFFVCVECWAEAGEEELVMLCRQSWERFWADDDNEFKWGDYCRALVAARADEKVGRR